MNEIYILHFVDPATGRAARLAHAGHYIGYCARGVPSRLGYHRAGRGSRLIAAVMRARLDFVVALVIPGDRTLERRLKNAKRAPELCPVCTGDARVYRWKRTGELFVRFRPRHREPLTRRIALYSNGHITVSHEEHANATDQLAG